MTLACTIRPVAPFRLDLTAWTLRRSPDNIIDRWDGQAYRRVLVLADRPVEVTVIQESSPEKPDLHILITGDLSESDVKPLVLTALQRLLGTQISLAGFYLLAGSRPELKPLVQRFRGFKPPRFQTLFEALVNAIACQQITLKLGIRLLNRLAEDYGLSVQGSAGKAYAFPRPQDLAPLSPTALRNLGFSHQKASAMIGLARAMVEGSLDGTELESMQDDQAIACLQQLQGVGRWTAEYVALRGLGRLDTFPGDDSGARSHLRDWLALPGLDGYPSVMRILEPWKPYRGLIYFHLLLKRLSEQGYINTT